MRDRLIALLRQVDFDYCEELATYAENGYKGAPDVPEYFADHLLANGVIVPPCKVGDNCYPLPRYKTPIVERKISRITFSKRNIIIGYYENDGQYRPPLRTRVLGDDVFLTREEAERALNGGE